MLTGLIANVITPMDSKGCPDENGIHALVNYLVNAKVNGLWVLGSAGEDVHLSVSHKIKAIRYFVDAINGRLPAVIGLGVGAFYDYMTLCDKVDTDKINAFHFLPYDQKIGDNGLIRYVEKLADALPCPLWLYHNPKRGRGFNAEVVMALKQHANIIGIKVGGYSLNDLTQMMMVADENFEVAGAGGGQLFQMLSLGANAHMTSDANCYPEVFLDMISLFKEGKRSQALDLQYRIIELSGKIPRTDNGEYAAEEKYMVMLRGVNILEYVNPAYRPLTKKEKNRIRILLKEFGFQWA